MKTRTLSRTVLGLVAGLWFATSAQSGLVKEEDTHLENYVTEKALDGLYTMIAEEGKAIRKNPVGAAGSLAQKVFGALK